MPNSVYKLRRFLIDETPFIEVIGRGSIDQIERLRMFLEDSRIRNSKRRYRLILPYVCRNRLGWKFPYSVWSSIRSKSTLLCSDSDLKEALQKRQKRLRYAKSIVSAPFIRRCFHKWLLFGDSELMDLFIFANGEKSKMLKASGKRLDPNQVIPLEVCLIAQIAHQHSLELLSFNGDYRFFANYSGKPNYILFRNFSEFLEKDYCLPRDA